MAVNKIGLQGWYGLASGLLEAAGSCSSSFTSGTWEEKASQELLNLETSENKIDQW